MTTYVYKSTTGHPVNIDNFTITPNPGLQLKYPNDILDTYLGTSINRYDDGVLVSSDPEVPVMARKTLTGEIELWAAGEQVTAGGGGLGGHGVGSGAELHRFLGPRIARRGNVIN